MKTWSKRMGGLRTNAAAEELTQMEADEAANAEEDARYEQSLKLLQAQIVSATDADKEYGWLDLSGVDEKTGTRVTLRVPKRAFICAALGRAKALHLMPEYTPVCYSGLKMPNDDRYHSDAWLGAGLPPDKAYNRTPESRLFMAELYELQRQLLSFKFDLLCRGSADYVSGKVTFNPEQAGPDKVLVLKEAHSKYAHAALKCAAVIVETGSRLAHLVLVSREESIPVFRIKNATKTLIEGRTVYLDMTEGTVEISSS